MASSPLWSIVDGPWKLLSANNDGYAKLGLNPHYSGPPAAHHINTFVIEPFTSEQAEFNVLQDPHGQSAAGCGLPADRRRAGPAAGRGHRR